MSFLPPGGISILGFEPPKFYKGLLLQRLRRSPKTIENQWLFPPILGLEKTLVWASRSGAIPLMGVGVRHFQAPLGAPEEKNILCLFLVSFALIFRAFCAPK